MGKKLKRVLVKAFSTEDAEEEVGIILRDALKQSGPEIFKALSSGLTRDEMIEKISGIVGKADGFAGTYVDTGLSVIGRERIADTAKELGLVWYRYIGGVIQTTREFCEERDGEYYHEDEIAEWADEDWDGKIDGTNAENIFSYCGGWNCRHSVIPVHESMVPEEDLKRMSNG